MSSTLGNWEGKEGAEKDGDTPGNSASSSSSATRNNHENYTSNHTPTNAYPKHDHSRRSGSGSGSAEERKRPSDGREWRDVPDSSGSGVNRSASRCRSVHGHGDVIPSGGGGSHVRAEPLSLSAARTPAAVGPEARSRSTSSASYQSAMSTNNPTTNANLSHPNARAMHHHPHHRTSPIATSTKLLDLNALTPNKKIQAQGHMTRPDWVKQGPVTQGVGAASSSTGWSLGPTSTMSPRQSTKVRAASALPGSSDSDTNSVGWKPSNSLAVGMEERERSMSVQRSSSSSQDGSPQKPGLFLPSPTPSEEEEARQAQANQSNSPPPAFSPSSSSSVPSSDPPKANSNPKPRGIKKPFVSPAKPTQDSSSTSSSSNLDISSPSLSLQDRLASPFATSSSPENVTSPFNAIGSPFKQSVSSSKHVSSSSQRIVSPFQSQRTGTQSQRTGTQQKARKQVSGKVFRVEQRPMPSSSVVQSPGSSSSVIQCPLSSTGGSLQRQSSSQSGSGVTVTEVRRDEARRPKPITPSSSGGRGGGYAWKAVSPVKLAGTSTSKVVGAKVTEASASSKVPISSSEFPASSSSKLPTSSSAKRKAPLLNDDEIVEISSNSSDAEVETRLTKGKSTKGKAKGKAENEGKPTTVRRQARPSSPPMTRGRDDSVSPSRRQRDPRQTRPSSHPCDVSPPRRSPPQREAYPSSDSSDFWPALKKKNKAKARLIVPEENEEEEEEEEEDKEEEECDEERGMSPTWPARRRKQESKPPAPFRGRPSVYVLAPPMPRDAGSYISMQERDDAITEKEREMARKGKGKEKAVDERGRTSGSPIVLDMEELPMDVDDVPEIQGVGSSSDGHGQLHPPTLANLQLKERRETHLEARKLTTKGKKRSKSTVQREEEEEEEEPQQQFSLTDVMNAGFAANGKEYQDEEKRERKRKRKEKEKERQEKADAAEQETRDAHQTEEGSSQPRRAAKSVGIRKPVVSPTPSPQDDVPPIAIDHEPEVNHAQSMSDVDVHEIAEELQARSESVAPSETQAGPSSHALHHHRLSHTNLSRLPLPHSNDRTLQYIQSQSSASTSAVLERPIAREDEYWASQRFQQAGQREDENAPEYMAGRVEQRKAGSEKKRKQKGGEEGQPKRRRERADESEAIGERRHQDSATKKKVTQARSLDAGMMSSPGSQAHSKKSKKGSQLAQTRSMNAASVTSFTSHPKASSSKRRGRPPKRVALEYHDVFSPVKATLRFDQCLSGSFSVNMTSIPRDLLNSQPKHCSPSWTGKDVSPFSHREVMVCECGDLNCWEEESVRGDETMKGGDSEEGGYGEKDDGYERDEPRRRPPDDEPPSSSKKGSGRRYAKHKTIQDALDACAGNEQLDGLRKVFNLQKSGTSLVQKSQESMEEDSPTAHDVQTIGELAVSSRSPSLQPDPQLSDDLDADRAPTEPFADALTSFDGTAYQDQSHSREPASPVGYEQQEDYIDTQLQHDDFQFLNLDHPSFTSPQVRALEQDVRHSPPLEDEEAKRTSASTITLDTSAVTQDSHPVDHNEETSVHHPTSSQGPVQDPEQTARLIAQLEHMLRDPAFNILQRSVLVSAIASARGGAGSQAAPFEPNQAPDEAPPTAELASLSASPFDLPFTSQPLMEQAFEPLGSTETQMIDAFRSPIMGPPQQPDDIAVSGLSMGPPQHLDHFTLNLRLDAVNVFMDQTSKGPTPALTTDTDDSSVVPESPSGAGSGAFTASGSSTGPGTIAGNQSVAMPISEADTISPGITLASTVDPSLLGGGFGMGSTGKGKSPALPRAKFWSRAQREKVTHDRRADNDRMAMEYFGSLDAAPMSQDVDEDSDYEPPSRSVRPPKRVAAVPQEVSEAVGPPKKNRSVMPWPTQDTISFCHMDRSSSDKLMMGCSKCAKTFCIRCFYTRNMILSAPFELKPDECPACANYCNCDQCCRRKGTTYTRIKKSKEEIAQLTQRAWDDLGQSPPKDSAPASAKPKMRTASAIKKRQKRADLDGSWPPSTSSRRSQSMLKITVPGRRARGSRVFEDEIPVIPIVDGDDSFFCAVYGPEGEKLEDVYVTELPSSKNHADHDEFLMDAQEPAFTDPLLNPDEDPDGKLDAPPASIARHATPASQLSSAKPRNRVFIGRPQLELWKWPKGRKLKVLEPLPKPAKNRFAQREYIGNPKILSLDYPPGSASPLPQSTESIAPPPATQNGVSPSPRQAIAPPPATQNEVSPSPRQAKPSFENATLARVVTLALAATNPKSPSTTSHSPSSTNHPYPQYPPSATPSYSPSPATPHDLAATIELGPDVQIVDSLQAPSSSQGVSSPTSLWKVVSPTKAVNSESPAEKPPCVDIRISASS